MHELTGKICKKRFGSIAGSPAVYSEEVDQITTDWLKEKIEYILKNYGDENVISIHKTLFEEILGLKEKSLDKDDVMQKFDELIKMLKEYVEKGGDK